jgi:hypothetical protein
MKKISWTDRVRNEEILHRVKEERNFLQTINRRKVKWIGHILRRNCLLKHVTEEKIKERIKLTERRGRRRKQVLDDFKEECVLNVKEAAPDRIVWRTPCGRGYEPVVRHTTE